MKIRIHVTEKDIREGSTKHGYMRCLCCPIARAINRKLKPEYRAHVTEASVAIKLTEKPETWSATVVSMPVTKTIREFILRYDEKNSPVKVKPTNFIVEIPSTYLKSNDTPLFN